MPCKKFPEIVAPFARRTKRLAAKQREIGLAQGGEAGTRMLTALAMPTSADTILRLVRNDVPKAIPTPRVVGMDDWAWCKGQRYGTIIVDLERHCPIDLLPDRSAESVAAWLKTHPGVEIVSRDRARVYIDGINRGAPDATQVADRWHLLQNLTNAMIRILEQNRACLYAAAIEPAIISEPEPIPEISTQTETTKVPPLSKAEQRCQLARERRLARYQAVMELDQQGVKMRAIARQLGIGRATVRRYIKAGDFPERAQRKKQPSILDPYLPYLNRRWKEGCHNGSQLYREIKKQGYFGKRPLVGRWAAKMRKQEPQSKPVKKQAKPISLVSTSRSLVTC